MKPGDPTGPLPAIDWARPWLAPYRPLGELLWPGLVAGETVVAALDRLAQSSPVRLAAGPLRFVPQSALPAGEAYEAFIFRTGSVPTRENLHDLFNGLVWLRFPVLKRRLNQLQAEQIAQAGVGQTRGPVRDALTLFDENAALWQPPEGLAQALRERRWPAVFEGEARAVWQARPPLLVGHALLEKLVCPFKSITAHVWLLPAVPLGNSRAGLEHDSLIAAVLADLQPVRLAAKPFVPLPVLGVPGWWPANTEAAFYADPAVFRPLRG